MEKQNNGGGAPQQAITQNYYGPVEKVENNVRIVKNNTLISLSIPEGDVAEALGVIMKILKVIAPPIYEHFLKRRKKSETTIELSEGAIALLSHLLLTPEIKTTFLKSDGKFYFDDDAARPWRLQGDYPASSEILAELLAPGLLEEKINSLYSITEKTKEIAEQIFEGDNLRVYKSFPEEAKGLFALFTKKDYPLDSLIYYGPSQIFSEKFGLGITIYVEKSSGGGRASFYNGMNIKTFCLSEKLFQRKVKPFSCKQFNFVPDRQGRIWQTRLSERGKQYVAFLKRIEQ